LGLTHELAHIGKLLAIFGLGAVELWAAFPVAIGLRVRPVVAGLVAGAGSMAAVLVIVTIGGPIRVGQFGQREERKSGATLAPLRGGGRGAARAASRGDPSGRGGMRGVGDQQSKDRLVRWDSHGILVRRPDSCDGLRVEPHSLAPHSLASSQYLAPFRSAKWPRGERAKELGACEKSTTGPARGSRPGLGLYPAAA
jgi:hypothetical protein